MVGQDNFLNDGDRPKTARQKRLARARDKQHVRLALSSTAPHGYYVFDEIITEDAGLLDYLAVGPLGLFIIPIRSDQGWVSRGRNENEVLLDYKPFEDDPFRQVQELAFELSAALVVDLSDITGLVCFTHADFELDQERRPPTGTTPIWELPWALDPEGQEETLTPADIEEIAEKVQKVYGRPPIVTPGRDQEWEGGA